MNTTSFTAIYNRFLGKITDDMYMELTPEDTVKDLRNLLIEAIPAFEFPRQDLYQYEIKTKIIPENEATTEDFIIGVIWEDLAEHSLQPPKVLVEQSTFLIELSSEEINILAILMKAAWLQRQVASVENVRQKYSGVEIYPFIKQFIN